MVQDAVGRTAQQVEVRVGETNVFAGGGVLAHCQGTGSTLAADSVAWFAGLKRCDMIGQKNPVHIRDTAMTLDATTAAYFLRQERLEAHKNVVAVNRNSGSVLRGPNLTYYRALKGVRDTLEMYASGRPTIDYRGTADSAEPYVIVADRVRFKGNDRMWGGGAVTIDRSDFAAREQVRTEVRAFGRGLSTMKRASRARRDSTADWITGDSLTARWAQQADPAGGAGGGARQPKSALHRVVSRGSARAFTHQYNQRDSLPSLNYSRGAMIDITLEGGKVRWVTVTGHADGVQLEPLPPAPPDTTKKKNPADTDKKKAPGQCRY